MPKPRKAKVTVTCSFCGQHMDTIPLLVVSNVSNAGVCTFCAMGVIEQTLKHSMQMEKVIKELTKPPEPPTTPRIEIVPEGTKPDRVDVAIGKALNNGK